MPLTPWSADVVLDLLSGGGLRLAAYESNATGLWPQPAGGFDAAPPATVAVTTSSPTRAVLRAAPRAYLLLGEQATPRGVGALARRSLFGVGQPTAPPAVASAGDDVLGAALFRIATQLTFGTERTLTPAEVDTHWTVGTLFPLPAWATDAAGARTWHVDGDRLVTAVTATGAIPAALSAELAGAGQASRELHGADPVGSPAPFTSAAALVAARTLRADLGTAVSAAGFDPAAEGGRLAVEALWNPYAAFFRLLETSLALDARAAAAGPPFAAAFWAALSAPERAVLARTSAGHVWLRRLWSSWGRPSAPAAAKADLKALLDLKDDDLAKRAPGAVGELEPPMFGQPALPTPSRTTVGSALPVMAFGRRVPFVGGAYPLDRKKWENFGVRYAGTVGPAQYFAPAAGTAAIDASLFPGANAAARAATREQWTRILAAISVTEGNLDAATSWDRAMASLGCQQFSMHEPKEGTALLERLKNVGPLYYDVVVRSLGIETGVEAGAASVPSATGAGVADLDRTGCFFVLTPGASPARHFAPGGTGDAAISDVRANVFDWVRNPDRTYTSGKRAMMLCARWAVVARYALEVWQAQAELSVHRIARTSALIRADGARWAPVLAQPTVPVVPTGAGGTTTATVFDLFGTEALLGLAVDMMINTPGHLNGAMRRAVLRTLSVRRTAAGGAPLPLDQAFFDQLILAFLSERYYRTADRTSMTRSTAIDVASERVRLLLPTIGSSGSTRSGLGDSFDVMLRNAGIGAATTMAPEARVVWP